MDVLLHYSLDCKGGLGPRFSKRLACVESVCSRVIARKLEREQKKCHSFFYSCPNLLDELARKRLLRRLRNAQKLFWPEGKF